MLSKSAKGLKVHFGHSIFNVFARRKRKSPHPNQASYDSSTTRRKKKAVCSTCV